jgi:hypothetical protein
MVCVQIHAFMRGVCVCVCTWPRSAGIQCHTCMSARSFAMVAGVVQMTTSPCASMPARPARPAICCSSVAVSWRCWVLPHVSAMTTRRAGRLTPTASVEVASSTDTAPVQAAFWTGMTTRAGGVQMRQRGKSRDSGKHVTQAKTMRRPHLIDMLAQSARAHCPRGLRGGSPHHTRRNRPVSDCLRPNGLG